MWCVVVVLVLGVKGKDNGTRGLREKESRKAKKVGKQVRRLVKRYKQRRAQGRAEQKVSRMN